jgi:hypothetical protein
MLKLTPFILIFLFTQCTSPTKDKVKCPEESKTIQAKDEEGKSSAVFLWVRFSPKVFIPTNKAFRFRWVVV